MVLYFYLNGNSDDQLNSPVIYSGGEYDGDRKMDDLKLLYRAYVSDSLSSGRMEESKVKVT